MDSEVVDWHIVGGNVVDGVYFHFHCWVGLKTIGLVVLMVFGQFPAFEPILAD